MPSDSETTFFFDTNIEEVLARINRGLAKVREAANGATSSPRTDNRVYEEMVAGAQRAATAVGRINKEFSEGRATAQQTLTSYSNLLREFDQQIGRQLGKRGVTVDVALQLREGAIEPIRRLLREQLGGLKIAAPDLPANARLDRLAKSDFTSAVQAGADDRGDYRQAKAAAQRTNRAARQSAEHAERTASADAEAARLAQEVVNERRAERQALRRRRATTTTDSPQARDLSGLEPGVTRVSLQERQKRAANFDDLYSGKPSVGGAPSLAEGVIAITPRLLKDTRGAVEKFFEVINHGAREIKEDSAKYAPALAAEAAYAKRQLNSLHTQALRDNRQFDKDREAAQARTNLDRVLPGGQEAQGATTLGGGYYKLVEDGQIRYFKKIADGLKELTDEASGVVEAQRRDIALSNKPRGFFANFAGGISSTGFGNDGKGFDLDSLGRSAGITAKYAVLGQTFFTIQQAIAQAGQELLDFEDSMTELNVAMEQTGNTASASFVGDLADSATLAGTNVGEAMDTAASGVRAFQNEIGDSQNDIEAFGTKYAAVSSKVATLTKTTLEDARGNVKAIGLAFDIPPNNLDRITDILVGAKQVGGGDEAQIGQGLANIGTAFNEIGFSAEETGTIISKVIAETDQGGTLVASRLSRIASIIGGSAGKSAIAKLNQQLAPEQQINTQGSVRDQILQLSKVYKGLGDAQRQQLINSLGGTANARELIILLENVNQLVTEADKGFTGKGAAEYEKRLGDIRAQVTKLVGELKQIITAIAESGILDPFLLLLKYGLIPILDGLRNLLELLQHIDRPIRTAVGSAIALYAAIKLIQGLGGKNGGGVTGFFNRIERIVAPANAAAREAGRAQRTRGIAGAIDEAEDVSHDPRFRRTASGLLIPVGGAGAPEAPSGRRFRLDPQADVATPFRQLRKELSDTATAFRAARTTGGTRGGLGAAIGAATPTFIAGAKAAPGALRAGLAASAAAIGPEGLAIGGAIAIQATYDATKKIIDATNEFDKLRTLPTDFNIDSLKESAKNLRSGADTLQHSTDGWLGKISNFLQGDPVGPKVADAKQQADLQEASAGRLTAAREAELQPGRTGKGAGLPSRTDILGGQLDFSNVDSLKNSLDQLSQSGATASEVADVFINRLDKIAEGAAGATTELTDYQKTQVAEHAGTAIQNFAFQRRDEARAQNAAVRGDAKDQENRMVGREDRIKLTPEQQSILRARNLDPARIGALTRKAVDQFEATGQDVNSEEGTKALRQLFEQNFKDALPDAKDRAGAVGLAFAAVRDETKRQFSDATSGLSNGELVDFVIEQSKNAGEGARNQHMFTSFGDNLKGDTADMFGADKALDLTRRGIADLRKRRKALTPEVNGAVTPQGLKEFLSKRQEIDADIDRLTELEKQQVGEKGAATLANLQSLAQLEQASIPDQNTVQRLDAQIASLHKQSHVDALTEEQRREINANTMIAERQRALAALTDQESAITAHTDVRDSVGNARNREAALRRQLTEYRGQKIKGQALTDLETQLHQAEVATQDAELNRAIAHNNARVYDGSSISQARAALDNARKRLATLTPTMDGYWDAFAEVQRQELALARDQEAAAHIAAQLAIDLSDPVAVANESLQEARDQLKRVRRETRNLPEDQRREAVNNATLNVRNKELEQQSTAFNEFLYNVQTAERLGRISNSAYLDHLRSKRDALALEINALRAAGDVNGIKQRQKQLDQLDELMKSAADQMSGQWNLGEIRLPTPYEVRRAVALRDKGSILRSNSPYSTAGNVTYDNSQRNITLNGVPIAEVMSMIQDLFGVKARTKAKRRVP